MSGVGVLVDAEGGAQVHADVVEIYGARVGELHNAVSTRADAWLPLTLLCEPQPEVQVWNPPRLARALQAFEAALGVPGEQEPEKKNADIVGYRLFNLGLDFNDPFVPPRRERALGLAKLALGDSVGSLALGTGCPALGYHPSDDGLRPGRSGQRGLCW